MLLRDKGLAEDALHDVFVKAVLGDPPLGGIADPVRYLYRACDNACIDVLRTNKRRASQPLDDHFVAPPGVDVPARDAVIHVLKSLSVEEQHTALLAYVDGLSLTEVASELGVSRVTIHKRIHSIRAKASLA